MPYSVVEPIDIAREPSYNMTHLKQEDAVTCLRVWPVFEHTGHHKAMSCLQITLFGALEVAHGNDLPHRPPTQKVVSLLGYLIAHRTLPQSREKLVELLWPDLPPRQGRRMLSDALWRTRRLLTAPNAADTPLLLVERDTVTFQPDGDTSIDLVRFDEATATVGDTDLWSLDSSDTALVPLLPVESERLREAVQLYRGDFLEECFDDWALIERERLRERYLSLLRRLLGHYLGSNQYDQALQMALRLTHADPLREEAHRILMRCYWLLGRTADALRAYEQCVAVLQTELDITPDDATVALYEQIRERRDAIQADTLPASLPLPAPLPFVGRRAERAALLQAVEAAIGGEGGVLLLVGEAGSGKSHLLREISAGATWRGAQVSAGFGREEDQSLPFGPLRQVLTQMLPAARRQELAATVGPSLRHLALLLPDDTAHPAGERRDDTLWQLEAGQAERQAQQMHEAITATLLALGTLAPQVVILEDLARFDTATLEALEYLLPRLTASRVLVIMSSRLEDLHQSPAIWQMIMRLDRISTLGRVHLDMLSIEECNELVRRALGMLQIPQRFSARLHNATGGNPFFVLETLRALQEQDLLTRDAGGHWHTPWDAPGADYHELPLATSLRQIIDARLQRLSANDRVALAAAAVLGQQCTPATWARMLDRTAIQSQTPKTKDADSDQSFDHGLSSQIDELLRRQFLVEERDGYRFGHETLRETVYTQLDAEERQQLHLRAAEALEHEHFAGVEALAQHFYRAGAWKEAQPYLLQAGDRAATMCAYRDAALRYNQALEASEYLPADESPAACCDVQIKRAEVAIVLGDYRLARAAYEHVLVLTDPVGRDAERRRRRIQALNGLCAVLSLTNEFERAAATMRQARALADAWPELRSRAATYYQAGSFCYHVDNYADAQDYLQQALGLYEALDSPEGQAHCLELLAWTWRRQEGVTDRVLHSLQQAMEIYTRLDDQYRQRHCQVSLANVYLLRGALDEVLSACDAVLSFFRATDARYKISECQYFRGVAFLSMGRYEEALAANGEARDISIELGIAAAAQVNQIMIGKSLAALGRNDEARTQLLDACASEDRLVQPRALTALAELFLAEGDLPQALEQLRNGLASMRTVGSQPFLGIALRVLGQVRAADCGGQLAAPTPELPDAESCFQQSISLLQGACLYGELGLSWDAYGSFLLNAGRLDQASEALRQASALLQRTGLVATNIATVQGRILSPHRTQQAQRV